MQDLLKDAIKSLLAKMDLEVARHSARVKSNIQSNIQVTTKAIGASGAAEALSHFIANHKQLSSDAELISFMDFYCNNWSLSSSQWSQDIFVMFASNLKRGGLFLEIGGADGYTHSNTYSLEKELDWKGTLVEPDPRQYKHLVISRGGNTLFNLAISPSGKEESFRLRLAGQLSALEGHEGKDMHLQTRLASRQSESVKGIGLTRLLKEKHYDYFSLDVEGAELNILSSIDWSLVAKPRILTVEHNFRREERNKIVSLLENQGYKEQFASHDWLRRGDVWAILDE